MFILPTACVVSVYKISWEYHFFVECRLIIILRMGIRNMAIVWMDEDSNDL